MPRMKAAVNEIPRLGMAGSGLLVGDLENLEVFAEIAPSDCVQFGERCVLLDDRIQVIHDLLIGVDVVQDHLRTSTWRL